MANRIGDGSTHPSNASTHSRLVAIRAARGAGVVAEVVRDGPVAVPTPEAPKKPKK